MNAPLVIEVEKENKEIAEAAGVPVGLPTDFVPASPGLSYSYETFSGIDVKVFVGGKSFPQAQAIVIEEDCNHGIKGQMTYIIFNGTDEIKESLFGSVQDIVLKAANEYGALSTLEIKDAKFDKWKWGIAVDDIVSEGVLFFSAKTTTSWKKHSK